MLDQRLERGWRALAAHDLTLDILVQNWREIPLAAQLASQLPYLRIVLDHCGKPDIAGGAFAPWDTTSTRSRPDRRSIASSLG